LRRWLGGQTIDGVDRDLGHSAGQKYVRRREENALGVRDAQVQHLFGGLAMLVDGAGSGEIDPRWNHDRDAHHTVGWGNLRPEVAIAYVQGDLCAGIGAQRRVVAARNRMVVSPRKGDVPLANSATIMAGCG